MSKVEVRDAGGKVLHTYTVHVDRSGPLIGDDVLFDCARRNAIDDELVSEDGADQLTYKVIE